MVATGTVRTYCARRAGCSTVPLWAQARLWCVQRVFRGSLLGTLRRNREGSRKRHAHRAVPRNPLRGSPERPARYAERGVQFPARRFCRIDHGLPEGRHGREDTVGPETGAEGQRAEVAHGNVSGADPELRIRRRPKLATLRLPARRHRVAPVASDPSVVSSAQQAARTLATCNSSDGSNLMRPASGPRIRNLAPCAAGAMSVEWSHPPPYSLEDADEHAPCTGCLCHVDRRHFDCMGPSPDAVRTVAGGNRDVAARLSG